MSSPTALFASGAKRRRSPPAFPGNDGGGKGFFSETQGPEDLQNRSYPGPWPRFLRDLITARQPVSEASAGLAEKRKRGLRTVQAAGPAADRGGIGHAIRVLETRQCLFPRAVLFQAPPQCLTARQQAVMGVRERKQREEGEGLAATGAATATDPNPIMMLIVRLLAAPPVADDRIAFTSRASPQDVLVAVCGPVRFKLVQRGRKWDKENRSSLGLRRRR